MHANSQRLSNLDRAAHDEKGSQIVELIAVDEEDLLEALSDRIQQEQEEVNHSKVALA